MKVTIKKLNILCEWKWDVDDDLCGICRNSFQGFCPDCKFPGDDCPPVWGACKHVFHMHCIVKWLQTKDTCPMDRLVWEYRNEESNN